MSAIVQVLAALLPTVALVALGAALRRLPLLSAAGWDGIERVTYFVLFPALLLRAMARAPLDRIEAGWLAVAVLGAIALMTLAGLALGRAMALSGPATGSVLQAVTRFNTYVGLALALALQGAEGVAAFAIVAAIAIPAVNLVAVWGHARLVGGQGQGPGAMAPMLAKNPLILAVLAGLALNLAGLRPGGWIDAALATMGDASIALGLLACGAGLDFAAARAAGRAVIAATALRLLLMPLAMAALLKLCGIEGLGAFGALLYACLPVAPTAYVLARQLGGDAALMAALIATTTLAAALTLPAMLGVLL